jgi:hypothetical protein
MGLVHLALYRSAPRSADAIRDEDRRQAADWLQKSIVAWREVESDPSFAPPRRKELEQVEAALADLERSRP